MTHESSTELTERQKKTRMKARTYKPEGEAAKTENPRIKLFKHSGNEVGDSRPKKVERSMDVKTLAGTMTNIRVESNDLAFFDQFVCYATARTDSDVNIFVCNSN